MTWSSIVSRAWHKLVRSACYSPKPSHIWITDTPSRAKWRASPSSKRSSESSSGASSARSDRSPPFGKRILDIASGSNSSRSPSTGKRTAVFEPWFARLALELGAEPVALDSGDLDGERFEHHRVDLGLIGALDFLADASFDGVQDSRLFGSPEFRKAYPRQRDHDRVRAEIARHERRVLKPDGVLIHSDNPRRF